MQIPISRRGGGGTDLNFTVVGGTTQPSNPKENTIWVNTETEITKWNFGASTPSDIDPNMVWFVIEADSPVSFNAIGDTNNAFIAHPISAYQYISGVWKNVSAKCYLNGEWEDLIMCLYKAGNEYTDFTGGWTVTTVGAKEPKQIRVGYTSTVSKHTSYATHNTPIFINEHIKTLQVHFVAAAITDTTGGSVSVRVENEAGEVIIRNDVINTQGSSVSDYTEIVDVSALTGYYRVKVCAYHTSSSSRTVYAYFDDVRLV